MKDRFKKKNYTRMWVDLVKKIGHITVLVKDQDEAARFYTEKLGFVKRQDNFLGPGMRWVTVSPKGQMDLELTFVKAETEDYLKIVGRQAARARSFAESQSGREYLLTR